MLSSGWAVERDGQLLATRSGNLVTCASREDAVRLAEQVAVAYPGETSALWLDVPAVRREMALAGLAGQAAEFRLAGDPEPVAVRMSLEWV